MCTFVTNEYRIRFVDDDDDYDDDCDDVGDIKRFINIFDLRKL